jgi:hypothetical protein
MFTKLCIAAAIALGCMLVAPGASLAADDKDKSATSTTKPAGASKSHKKKGHSDTVHENAGLPKKPKKGHADTVHDNPR